MNYGDGRATHLQWTEHARIQQKWAIHFSEMKQLTQGEIGRFSQCQNHTCGFMLVTGVFE
jgi:predicted RNA-binding Zn ribbon-like protein